VVSTTESPTAAAEEEQHGTDDEKDYADRPEDRDGEDQSQYEK
jgi:hypothetical protein